MAEAVNPTPVASSSSTSNSNSINAQLVSVNPAYTSSTTVNSLADLKKKAPQVYNAMLQGIAQNICSDMQASEDRLKQLTEEGEDNPNGG